MRLIAPCPRCGAKVTVINRPDVAVPKDTAAIQVTADAVCSLCDEKFVFDRTLQLTSAV